MSNINRLNSKTKSRCIERHFTVTEWSALKDVLFAVVGQMEWDDDMRAYIDAGKIIYSCNKTELNALKYLDENL